MNFKTRQSKKTHSTVLKSITLWDGTVLVPKYITGISPVYVNIVDPFNPKTGFTVFTTGSPMEIEVELEVIYKKGWFFLSATKNAQNYFDESEIVKQMKNLQKKIGDSISLQRKPK